MAHFLVLCHVFPPDEVSTAQIMGELSEDLAAAGHRVSVLTTTPYYNPDQTVTARQPLARSWVPFVRTSRIGTVRVWHAVMPRRKRHLLARALAWAWYNTVSTILAMGLPRADVILACSPPLTVGLSSWLVGLFHRAPYVYNVQELYPDIAVRLGVIHGGPLLNLMLGLERFVYRKAARVTTISPGMRRRLLEKGVPEEKALFIPNFVDLDRLTPVAKDNPFSQEHGLVEKFVVSYAGNLGLAQGLDAVLDAAYLLRDEARIRFVIMGTGVLRESLERRIRGQDPGNVLLLPYQPFARMSEVYGASDLNLVPIASDTGADALPSKVYRILACGRPILAVADSDSDLAAFVREARCGLVVPPHSPEAIQQAIRSAATDLGALARQVREHAGQAVAAYTRPEVTTRYRVLLEELARSGVSQ